MIGRLARSRVIQAAVLVGGIVVAYLKGQPVTPIHSGGKPEKFSLDDRVPILDKYEDVHEIGFLFPTESQSRLVFQTSEQVIRCEDGTNKFSHKVLNHTETGLPSTIKCIKVFNEISAFGPDAVIREDARHHQRDTNKPKPPATLRAVMLNTAGKEGMCTTDKNKKTCVPSLHIMDFDFSPPSVTAEHATKWGGTMEEVREAMEMAESDLTRAEKACQKARDMGKTGYKAEECERRATIAVQQFARSVHRLGQTTAADRNRVLSENSHALFGSAAAIPRAEVAVTVPIPPRNNNTILG